MALFAQKMNQDILSACHFVQTGGNIPQFPFCTNVIEESWKNSCELFDQIIDRGNIRVQEPGNITGKEVCILDKNAFKTQVNDQAGQQPG